VLDVLRKPPIQVAAGTTEAASEHIITLMARIRLVNPPASSRTRRPSRGRASSMT
jgi:hypothetical protein